ncbi:hypothetical protein CB0940_11410 [Cercospora beticola]|uniref:Uncharacterized protein n=1 Tax=Cercospora beticola TaxID=122368 RepID=A0A2G5HEG1_CERBT|nr:hypothetical protein CB0940_11410 [Cercospora beticola]PIA90940.1 hypothetical protein CB0940_11410 [Cercospora beticola]WPB08260.1 hypothetical protein RHO25_012925 [Cercospora beticola]
MSTVVCFSRRKRRILLQRLVFIFGVSICICLVFFPSTARAIVQSLAGPGIKDTEVVSKYGKGSSSVPDGFADAADGSSIAGARHEEYESSDGASALDARRSEYELSDGSARLDSKHNEHEMEEQPRMFRGRPQYPGQRRGGPPPRQEQQPLKKTKDRSEEDIADKIRDLEALLPSDDFMEDLLSPLPEVGGPTLLHALTIRTRMFKEAFEAWEDLHLHEDGTSAVQSQDVINRLSKSKTLSRASRKDAIHVYDTFRAYFTSLAELLFPWTMPYYSDHMSLHTSFYQGGKGIVFTGGDKQVRYIMTSIRGIREMGCMLPVEVLFLGDEDIREENRDKLEEIEGVTTRNIAQMIRDEGWTLRGWAAKPFAILMSSFREVIFIDADALFLQTPDLLFHSPGYVETGALFFKDRNLMPENRRDWIKSILPRPHSANVKKNRMWTGESGHMQDSGVVVIDKWKHFVALLLTTRMNGPDRDGDKKIGKKGVYEMVYGDKETFWLSWEMAGDLGYSFHDSVAGTMGTPGPLEPAEGEKAPEEEVDEDEDERKPVGSGQEPPNDKAPKKKKKKPKGQGEDTVCSSQLLHFDDEGMPFWFNGWLARSKEHDASLEIYPRFDGYMTEPPETGKHEKEGITWHVRKSNVVCLHKQTFTRFTYQDQNNMKMLVRIAKEYV